MSPNVANEILRTEISSAISDQSYSLHSTIYPSIRQDLTKTKFRCRLRKFGMLLIDKFIENVRAYVTERTRAVLIPRRAKKERGGLSCSFWIFFGFIFIFYSDRRSDRILIRRLFCFTADVAYVPSTH